ncbi:helix-turn-helix domain-containing protein [Psychrobacillus sp. NPDC096389]|uniref:helix-turn-helix domain-containing protein n=1 Tax=Psychrobacillus sp. NPDC096389 TaxID=3364490 RepID=UPI00380D5055
MKSYGETLKKIRLSKNYDQSMISGNIIHQSSYSKYELGKINMTVYKFEKVLSNLGIDYEELKFIHHSYNYDAKVAIVTRFNNLKFIDELILKEIIAASEVYLKNIEDPQIRDILLVSHGFLAIKKENNFELASLYADEVWNRLQTLDTWYLADIRLINSILFLFKIETAISISQFAIKQLTKYQALHDYQKLIYPFKYNLVQLLIREKNWLGAYQLNEELIVAFKEEKAYVQIALTYLRKGLLQKKIAMEDEVDFVEKAFEIATVLDDEKLHIQLETERKQILDFIK